MIATAPELSFVIPVYNGGSSIGRVVQSIFAAASHVKFEIVLVNDGSLDDSEQVCRALAETHPNLVFVQLAKNFGEHAAVLAGLAQSRGDFVAILDDDGQNPPSEVLKMLSHIKQESLDVVYGNYIEKKHSFFRNLGSSVNDRMAVVMLKKPKDLYLSSFKILNRFLVEEITHYQGPFPYIDGLILRSTARIGQIAVVHEANRDHRSNYTLRKLLKLWSNMFLSFSILPLRVSALVGLMLAAVSGIVILAIIIDKIWITPHMTAGVPSILAGFTFFSGVQLLILGVLGEYLGRLYLDQTKTPQYVVRYKHQRGKA